MTEYKCPECGWEGDDPDQLYPAALACPECGTYLSGGDKNV